MGAVSGMNEKRLQNQCQSQIERDLLAKLYPDLSTSRVRELRAQYRIDKYHDVPVTIADFAFPDMQIAVYCDGFGPREGDRNAFRRDRLQSRELQLKGWIVLRFAGSEIYSDCDMVVDTIQRAITRRYKQRRRRKDQQQQEWQQPKSSILVKPPAPQTEQGDQKAQKYQAPQKPEGGLCGVIFLASVIVGVLVLLDFIF